MPSLKLKLAAAALAALALPAVASAEPYFADHGRTYGYERGYDAYERDGPPMWGRRFDHHRAWRHDRFERRWGHYHRSWRMDRLGEGGWR